MDKIDTELLKILQQDARTPFLQIAKHLGVSEGTIRKRVKDMISNRIIKNFTVNTHQDTSAIVEVITEARSKTHDLSSMIRNYGNVTRVLEVAGRFTILVFVKAGNLEEVNDVVEQIRELEGVVQTETFPVLKEVFGG